MRNAKYLSDNSEHENISNHKRSTCIHRRATRLINLRRYIDRRDADGPLLSDADRCAVPVRTEATTTYRTSGWLAPARVVAHDPGGPRWRVHRTVSTNVLGTRTVLARSGSPVPVYISGYDQGYEEIPFPGLYDPMTAGDVSPLLNAFEVGAVVGSSCPMVDSFRVDMAPEPRAVKLLTALAEVCDRTQDPGTVRCALNELSCRCSTARCAPRRARRSCDPRR